MIFKQDMTIDLSLTSDQYLIYSHPSRFKVISAGRRWGKTFLSIRTLLMEAINQPDQVIWYVAPTYGMAKAICWRPLKKLLKENFWLIKKINESDLTIELINDSIIVLKGADYEDSLRGEGIDYLIMDEVAFMKKTVWTEILRPALADKLGMALFISSPDGFNFFHGLYTKGLKSDEPDYISFTFKTVDSPFIQADEVEKARRDMDEISFRQEFEASFETITDRAYYGFSRLINVFDYDYVLKPEDDLCLSFDFNLNPMSGALFAINSFGFYQLKEFRIFSSNSKEIALSAIQYLTETRPDILRAYGDDRSIILTGDATGARGDTRGNESDFFIIENTLNDADIPAMLSIPLKNPSVRDRVNLINTLHQSQRLWIHESCTWTINDKEQMTWKAGANFVLDKKSDSPLSHASDASDYAVWNCQSLVMDEDEDDSLRASQSRGSRRREHE